MTADDSLYNVLLNGIIKDVNEGKADPAKRHVPVRP